jgi:hypothetical protein
MAQTFNSAVVVSNPPAQPIRLSCGNAKLRPEDHSTASIRQKRFRPVGRRTGGAVPASPDYSSLSHQFSKSVKKLRCAPAAFSAPFRLDFNVPQPMLATNEPGNRRRPSIHR